MHKNIFFLLILLAFAACRPYSQEVLSFEPSNLGNIPDSTTVTIGTNYKGEIHQFAVFINKNNTLTAQGFLAQSTQNQLFCNDENGYSFVFKGADTYDYVVKTVGNVAKGEEAKQWTGSFSATKDSACKTILLAEAQLLPVNEKTKVQFWLQAGTSTGFQSGDTTTILVSIFRPDNSKVLENVPLRATATGFQPLCEPSNNYPFAILSLHEGTYFAQIKYAGITKNIPNFTLNRGVCSVINL
jgi:hypothetical protein